MIVLPSRVTNLPCSAHALVGGVVHADDHDLVVGEQVLVDGLGEGESVEDGTERGFVVHRRDLEVGFLRLADDPPGEVAGRGGHEQATLRANLRGVEDRGEVTAHRPGAAVRLVADRQVEPGRLRRCFAVRGGDLGRGLVGREDHPRSAATQERGDLVRGRS